MNISFETKNFYHINATVNSAKFLEDGYYIYFYFYSDTFYSKTQKPNTTSPLRADGLLCYIWPINYM